MSDRRSRQRYSRLRVDDCAEDHLLGPEALAPVARLMGVGDILVRSDLQYERYRIARPRLLWDLIGRADGLGRGDHVRSHHPEHP